MIRVTFLIISLVFLLDSVKAQRDLKIIELRGLEDNAGVIHLFYREDVVFDLSFSEISSSTVYHFDTGTRLDIEFLPSIYSPNPYYTDVLFYKDFDFWENDPYRYISIGYESGMDPDIFIQRFDAFESDYKNVAYISSNGSTRIFISSHDQSMVCANVLGYCLASNDSGRTWPDLFDKATQFNLISLSKNLPDVLFGTDSKGNLLRSSDSGKTAIMVENSGYWSVDSKFQYDADKTHIYAVTRYDDLSILFMSDANGDPFSWKKLAESGNRILLTADDSVSGNLYFASHKNLSLSNDYGESFTKLRKFDQQISGLYKKPDSDTLYISTVYNLYEFTADSCILLKRNSIANALKFYPLERDNKWIYTFKTWSDWPDGYGVSSILSREVIGDTLFDNGKKYFIIRERYHEWNNERLLFERFDSLSGKVYSLNPHNPESQDEIIVEDLCAVPGDTVTGNHFEYVGSLPTYILNDFDDTFFVKIRTARENYASGLEGHQYILVSGIGLYSDHFSFDFGQGNWNLLGCIIDGHVYGDTSVSNINEFPHVPVDYILYQNYPNPFNPQTLISYQLSASGKMELSIYNITGQKVRTLANGQQTAGRYEVVWDGTDATGSPVASGIYFYRIKAGEFVQTKRMLLMR